MFTDSQRFSVLNSSAALSFSTGYNTHKRRRHPSTIKRATAFACTLDWFEIFAAHRSGLPVPPSSSIARREPGARMSKTKNSMETESAALRLARLEKIFPAESLPRMRFNLPDCVLLQALRWSLENNRQESKDRFSSI
jgi:hypothetical protein